MRGLPIGVRSAKEERLPELAERLEKDEFLSMRPFGVSVTFSLRAARRRPDGGVVWEEEDYCSPPLAQERAAVLDEYFQDLRVTAVQRDEGWAQIRDLPPLFPDLVEYREAPRRRSVRIKYEALPYYE